MRGHEVEKAGFVCGVAEATEIVDTGFRELHGLETQNGYGDLSFIAHAAQAGGVFRPGIDLKAGAGLLREVSGVAGLRLSQLPVELLLQLVVELHVEHPAALALNLLSSLVVEAVEVGIMICFFGLHEARVDGLVFRYEVVMPDEALPSLGERQ